MNETATLLFAGIPVEKLFENNKNVTKLHDATMGCGYKIDHFVMYPTRQTLGEVDEEVMVELFCGMRDPGIAFRDNRNAERGDTFDELGELVAISWRVGDLEYVEEGRNRYITHKGGLLWAI